MRGCGYGRLLVSLPERERGVSAKRPRGCSNSLRAAGHAVVYWGSRVCANGWVSMWISAWAFVFEGAPAATGERVREIERATYGGRRPGSNRLSCCSKILHCAGGTGWRRGHQNMERGRARGTERRKRKRERERDVSQKDRECLAFHRSQRSFPWTRQNEREKFGLQ